MVPCIARDDHTALSDDGKCVYCAWAPRKLLRELKDNGVPDASVDGDAACQADHLRDIVFRITTPSES